MRTTIDQSPREATRVGFHYHRPNQLGLARKSHSQFTPSHYYDQMCPRHQPSRWSSGSSLWSQMLSVDLGFPFHLTLCLLHLGLPIHLRVEHRCNSSTSLFQNQSNVHTRWVHSSSLSSFSCFPVVAPSNQSFSLLFTHLLQLFVPANSSSALCLLFYQIILYCCNCCLCFLLAVA